MRCRIRVQQKRITGHFYLTRFGQIEYRRQCASVDAPAPVHPEVRRDVYPLRVQHFADMARDEPSPVIGWNRIVAAADYDPRAIGGSSRVMVVDQEADPRRLAVDVAIISAVANAGIHQLRTVEAERSGGSGHNPSLRRQTIECIIVVAVGNENVHAGRIHGIELRSISARDGPSQSCWSELPAVLDRLPSGESRGSIQDDVIFAAGDGHPLSLSGPAAVCRRFIGNCHRASRGRENHTRRCARTAAANMSGWRKRCRDLLERRIFEIDPESRPSERTFDTRCLWYCDPRPLLNTGWRDLATFKIPCE